MTDDNNPKLYDLSRRRALAGLGAIGIASASAGVGTSAYFSDEESFDDNSITAGEFDLYVDYTTSVDQDEVETGGTPEDGSPNTGTIQGGVSGQYQIADVKPGDSGELGFDPKIVDNSGWVFVGSVDGVTDYENGQTEPEEDVDGTGGGNLDSGTNDGQGAGELSEAIQVTVKYNDPNGGEREFNNPADYTLADLLKELESGFLLDGEPFSSDPSGTQPYPGSPDQTTQNGPGVVIEWEVPTSVGNEIQSDAVEFDITFDALQFRNNGEPENPFADTTVFPGDDLKNIVSNAGQDEIISVFGGTFGDGSSYTNPLNIDTQGLKLARASAERPFIEAQVVASAAKTKLSGFRISPPPADSNPTGEAVRVSNSSDDVVIANNIVEDFEHDTNSSFSEDLSAINVFGGNSADAVENVTVLNNVVRRIDGPSGSGSVGISIQGNVDEATVRGNNISEVGEEESSYAFGVVIRGTDNHSVDPKNVDIVSNDISSVLASDSTPYLGVGFGVEADGTDYLARDNTIDNVNIGVELKGAATETVLTGNSISNIDDSVNDTNYASIPRLYLGDQAGSAPIGMFITDNSYDVPVKSDGPFGPIDNFGTIYQQAIVPQ